MHRGATEEVSVDGERFFVATGARALPQGAPSSPALTNILCRRLDAHLQACAARLGFHYTRYADDLTFSADEQAAKLVGKLLWRARQIVVDKGFTPHPDKQHVMRAARARWIDGETAQLPTVTKEAAIDFRALAAGGQAQWDGWWQAAGPAAPVHEQTARQVVLKKRQARAAPAVQPMEEIVVEEAEAPADETVSTWSGQISWKIILRGALAQLTLGYVEGNLGIAIITCLILAGARKQKYGWLLLILGWIAFIVAISASLLSNIGHWIGQKLF